MTNATAVSKKRALWSRILTEAAAVSEREPTLSSFLQHAVLRFDNPEDALCQQLADVLASPVVTSEKLWDLFSGVLKENRAM